MRLLQPQKRRLLPAYAPHSRFSRWLGRPLTPSERRVIDALEARRLHSFPSPRVIILDPPGTDSSLILADYIRYLAHLHGPAMTTAVIAPGRDTALEFAYRAASPCLTATGATARNLRGATYQRLVILDPQRFGKYSPFHHVCWYSQPWKEIYCQLIGPIELRPDHLCIVRITLPDNPVEARRMLDNLGNSFPEAFSRSPELNQKIQQLREAIAAHNRDNLAPIIIECPIGQPPEEGPPPDSPPDTSSLVTPTCNVPPVLAAGCPATQSLRDRPSSKRIDYLDKLDQIYAYPRFPPPSNRSQ